MKLVRGLFVVALVVAALGTAIWYATRPTPPRVTVHVVATGTVEATVANTRAGTVKAERRAKLAPGTGGQVARLHVHAGDRVAKDQVLMELWNDDLLAERALVEREIEQSRAAAEAARLNAELAERDAARQRELLQQHIASPEAVDKATSAAEVARADQLAAATAARAKEAQLGTIHAAIERTIVRAPFAGIVAEVNGEVGEFVTPSPVGIPTPPAVDLIDDGSLYVSAPIDEVDAAQVRVGMDVRVTLDAFGKRAFRGRVRRIAPYVLDREKQARTAEVEVDFVELPTDVHLLAGYSADAEILLQQQAGVLRVPTEAVRDGDTVLVVRADGTLEQRTIRKGLANWRHTEVLDGLAAGDRVVVASEPTGVAAGERVVVGATAAGGDAP